MSKKAYVLVTVGTIALCAGIGFGAIVSANNNKPVEQSADQATYPGTLTKAPKQTTTVTTRRTSEVQGVGARSNPVPLGDSATVGDWTITGVAFTSDATQFIEDWHDLNPLVEEGSVYIQLEADIAYNGTGDGLAYRDLIVRFVDEDGFEYPRAEVIFPDEVRTVGKIAPGETRTIFVAFVVPMDAVDHGLFEVLPRFATERVATFFAKN